MFLAQYYMKMGSYREAEAHAHKATKFVKVSGGYCQPLRAQPWTRVVLVVLTTITDSHVTLVQTKEEGKSLLQEISKLKAVQESTSKQVAADLALIDIDHEFSPISSAGTT